jgi:hypothetical protein
MIRIQQSMSRLGSLSRQIRRYAHYYGTAFAVPQL